MNQAQHDQLKIGDSIQIKRRLMTRISVLYTGMSNDRTVSLVVTRTAGHMGMGYNLYLPTSERHLDIAEIPITIHGICPSTLQLALN